MAKSKKDLKIIRKSKRVEFWYKEEFFIYERRSDSSNEHEYIWRDQEKIYGPFHRDCTVEGVKAYNIIRKKLYGKK